MENFNISDSLFHKFSDLLYKKAGLKLPEHKKYLLEYRLAKYIGEQTGYYDFQQFYDALISDNDILTIFLQEMTTNYTYFFREFVHFKFVKYYLYKYGINEPYINIWSAGCASGEEPYSIAITVNNCNDLNIKNKTKILATDISPKVLKKAISGIFSKRSIEENAEIDIKKYFSNYFIFDKTCDSYKVSQDLKDLISFRIFNLVENFPFKKQFDIVFLRNVLIYFENDVKEQILSKMYEIIKPSGFLIISLSESLVGVKHNFIQKKYSIYKKNS